jgi:hypothetical protein
MTTRQQWRIMWTHATGEENGAQWRDKRPERDELAEWLEDFNPLALRVETRVVHESAPDIDDTGMQMLSELVASGSKEGTEH